MSVAAAADLFVFFLSSKSEEDQESSPWNLSEILSIVASSLCSAMLIISFSVAAENPKASSTGWFFFPFANERCTDTKCSGSYRKGEVMRSDPSV
jgi:hypothetical protein